MNVQTYQWNAADYAQSSTLQQQLARELIQKLNLKGNERLLDIGSGDGKVTAEIAGYLPNGFVIGVDNSESMVTLAQSKYSADAFPNLRFQRGDASSLSFRNEFDIVFSNAALHWVLDHRPVLQGIFSSLKHGGRILLQMGGKGNVRDVERAFESLIKKNEWSCYFQGFNFPYGFYDADEYRRWLRDAGFQIIRVELIPKEGIHQNRKALEAWIRTTWLPHTQQVPAEKRDTFITQFAKTYLENHPPEDDGRMYVNLVRLEVEARK
jgi:trans-aconitate 2-methyltransferase